MKVRTSGVGRFSSAVVSSASDVTLRAVVEIAGGVERHAVLALRATCAVTSKLSSARPIGSMNRWHELQVAFLRWISIARASSAGGLPSLRRRLRDRERRAAAAAAACRAALPSPTCRAAPARCDWRARSARASLPWPRMPRRVVVGIRHAAELVADDAGDAVVAREPLVEERVVGASADRARCGPRCTRLLKNSFVSVRIASARFSSKFG